jgi:hypothetical protein
MVLIKVGCKVLYSVLFGENRGKLLVEDIRFGGGVMMQKSFSLNWSNICSFTLGRFYEVEDFL